MLFIGIGVDIILSLIHRITIWIGCSYNSHGPCQSTIPIGTTKYEVKAWELWQHRPDPRKPDVKKNLFPSIKVDQIS
uniref:Uncharacterized protein n=1 Tax=Arundo donax TaxID=35708 RepID=A0A0A8Z4S6_ARUDO